MLLSHWASRKVTRELIENDQDSAGSDDTLDHRWKGDENVTTHFYLWKKTMRVGKTVMGSGQYLDNRKHGKLGPRDSSDQVTRRACKEDLNVIGYFWWLWY